MNKLVHIKSNARSGFLLRNIGFFVVVTFTGELHNIGLGALIFFLYSLLSARIQFLCAEFDNRKRLCAEISV